MLLAIADPPYLGQARRYPEHPEAAVWDDPQTHLDLLARLEEEYEAWVLACNTGMLRLLLPVASASVRVGVWAKTRAGGSRPNLRIGYAHEHMLWDTSRRGGLADMRRTDVLICAVTQRRGVVGAKPRQWTQWVLDLLGYDPGGDEVHDLYPGSGDVSAAIADYRTGCAWCTRPMEGRRDRQFRGLCPSQGDSHSPIQDKGMSGISRGRSTSGKVEQLGEERRAKVPDLGLAVVVERGVPVGCRLGGGDLQSLQQLPRCDVQGRC